MDKNRIIIGAGASGLAAAYELIKAGMEVTIIEARDKPGGRINTLRHSDFTIPLETGAEFIHGNLPVSLSFVKEAGIYLNSMEGKTYRVKKGELLQSEDFIAGFPVLISKLNELKKDIPFSEFLIKNFSEVKYNSLRESVTRFIEGYDAAEVNKVSSFALREEWTNENVSNSYRLKGGYSQLINFFADKINAAGSVIIHFEAVKEIHWKENSVNIITDKGRRFESEKVLITIPISVLTTAAEQKGHIIFNPALTDKIKAANEIGYGTVIKFFYEFKESFWENKISNKSNTMPELGFLLSDAVIPTWWTQLPDRAPVLTGWLAGPKADKLHNEDIETLIDLGIQSLAYIFGVNENFIRSELKAKHVVNWKADPFSLGAYAYSTVDSKEARKVLMEPVEHTLYFAGEALYEGYAMGTVEAALTSGIAAAKEMLKTI